jgi:prevent-host-death family protein
MQVASIAEIKACLSAYVDASQDGPVVVTRNGRPVAVLLAVEDDEELERLVLAYSPRFRKILEASRRQIRDDPGMGHEEFWSEVSSEQE